jgi:hypothetical protein
VYKAFWSNNNTQMCYLNNHGNMAAVQNQISMAKIKLNMIDELVLHIQTIRLDRKFLCRAETGSRPECTGFV